MAYTTIDNPELYFQSKLYAGDGNSTQAITLDGSENMQPDLVWLKNRTDQVWHVLTDSVQGAGAANGLSPNSNEAPGGGNKAAYGFLSAFGSDGFTVSEGSSNASMSNQSSKNYVAWCWKGGGSASSNSDGDITTSISASTTAGFSIVSYTSNGSSNQTVGHGLGAVPHMIISKNRDNTSTHYNDWVVYHHSNATANDKKLKLNTTDAVSTTNEWGDTDPTSTVYSVHTSGDGATNDGTDKIVSYVFTGIQGFSKFGSYTGNGNADGAFIYTGFRPAWLMIKRSSASGNSWEIFDNKRLGYNVDNNNIRADGDDAEYTTDRLDILSNGFKCRATTTNVNGSGSTYVYMAFAEAPFVNSNGVPCNAR